MGFALPQGSMIELLQCFGSVRKHQGSANAADDPLPQTPPRSTPIPGPPPHWPACHPRTAWLRGRRRTGRWPGGKSRDRVSGCPPRRRTTVSRSRFSSGNSSCAARTYLVVKFVRPHKRTPEASSSRSSSPMPGCSPASASRCPLEVDAEHPGHGRPVLDLVIGQDALLVPTRVREPVIVSEAVRVVGAEEHVDDAGRILTLQRDAGTPVQQHIAVVEDDVR